MLSLGPIKLVEGVCASHAATYLFAPLIAPFVISGAINGVLMRWALVLSRRESP